VGRDSTEVLGAVLAGGRGTRIGEPKATLTLGGRMLLEHPLNAFAHAGIEAVVVAKPSTSLPPLPVEVWREPDEPSHPLLGIVTALEHAGGRAVLVCGCDMPFVSPGLLTSLATSDGLVVVPSAGGQLHPLLACYRADVLEPLRRALDELPPLQETIAALEPTLIGEEELHELGNPDLLLFNVNERADLEQAEKLLRDHYPF
jgi:molybdopterin-guanine dinucleotide biosynthesis protein A